MGWYLAQLGRLDAAAHCYERGNEPDYKKENWDGACRGNQNLAEVFLLGGHVTAGLRAAEEALRLAERADDPNERNTSHAHRGHARALRGETDLALRDFREALHWQHEFEGETDRALWSLRGIRHTHLLARLGRNKEATELTEANKRILVEVAGARNYHEPPCNLLLADLARERGDLSAARELLQEAHEWAIARDAKEPLCWSAWVRARIELSVFSCQLSDSGEHRGGEDKAEMEVCLEQARYAIEEGLRIARDCGFGIYHIDLLLTRAQVALYEGNPADAQRDARVALNEGVHPPADSGLPELLSATDKECGYAWGIAEGRHLLAEALLLQTAQTLASRTWKPRSRQTPPEVREMIKSAREELRKCARLRKRIQDPKIAETERLLESIKSGQLTEYPLEPETLETEQDDAGVGGPPPSPVLSEKRFDIALSFPGEKRHLVEAVAVELARNRGRDRVFYDKNFEAELARPDLDTYLQAIYHDQSELIVIFLCEEYEKKEWCGLEWRAIRDLIKKRKSADIMPLRFDNTHIPGLFSIDGYVSLTARTPKEIAKLITERLEFNRRVTA